MWAAAALGCRSRRQVRISDWDRQATVLAAGCPQPPAPPGSSRPRPQQHTAPPPRAAAWTAVAPRPRAAQPPRSGAGTAPRTDSRHGSWEEEEGVQVGAWLQATPMRSLDGRQASGMQLQRRPAAHPTTSVSETWLAAASPGCGTTRRLKPRLPPSCTDRSSPKMASSASSSSRASSCASAAAATARFLAAAPPFFLPLPIEEATDGKQGGVESELVGGSGLPPAVVQAAGASRRCRRRRRRQQ